MNENLRCWPRLRTMLYLTGLTAGVLLVAYGLMFSAPVATVFGLANVICSATGLAFGRGAR